MTEQTKDMPYYSERVTLEYVTDRLHKLKSKREIVTRKYIQNWFCIYPFKKYIKKSHDLPKLGEVMTDELTKDLTDNGVLKFKRDIRNPCDGRNEEYYIKSKTSGYTEYYT